MAAVTVTQHIALGRYMSGDANNISQECSRLAFSKKGRSLQASDLTDEVHISFLNIFGEDEAVEESRL